MVAAQAAVTIAWCLVVRGTRVGRRDSTTPTDMASSRAVSTVPLWRHILDGADLPPTGVPRHPRRVSRILTSDEIAAQLPDLTDWAGDTVALRRSVEFADFPTAITAVDRVAEVAEEMSHHPDIDIRWRTVTFALSTHSAGGVTQLDVELAHRIDAIAASLDS